MREFLDALSDGVKISAAAAVGLVIGGIKLAFGLNKLVDHRSRKQANDVVRDQKSECDARYIETITKIQTDIEWIKEAVQKINNK